MPGGWAVTGVARILVLAGLVFLTGRFGLLFALEPGLASVVWPLAGLALAVVLLDGRRAWAGVWLGGFLINLGNWAAPMAGLIATGSTVQAIVGAILVRRLVAQPIVLESGSQVARLLLLGGPVSCVVGASIGVGSLAASGAIPPGAVAIQLVAWWIGDSTGVVLALPIFLAWRGRPAAAWRPRRLSVALPIALALLFTLGAFTVARQVEERGRRLEFEGRAEALARLLDRELQSDLDGVAALGSFAEASGGELDDESFRSLAQPILDRHPSLLALSWNPIVPDERRDRFARLMNIVRAFIALAEARGAMTEDLQTLAAEVREDYIGRWFRERGARTGRRGPRPAA